jgi:hypothetical protein
VKLCTKCNQTKTLEHFHKVGRNRKSPDGLRTICKDCAKATMWGPSMKKRYGLTIEQYEQILANQNYACAICETKTPKGLGKFEVDHCHQTNQIRGLLCRKCNSGIGLLGDNVDGLAKAVAYLRKAEL